MLKLVLTAALGVLIIFSINAQLKRFYSLSEVRSYDTVDFTLKATSGISFVRHVNGGNPLNIFGNPDLDKINPSFDARTVDGVCYVKLILDEYRSSGLGSGLSFAMMSSKQNSEEDANYWKLLLNDNKIYNLNLNYGIGSSDIDLGGVFVKKLKINTGSANVIVNYKNDGRNKMQMDTFMVKVDLGSLIAMDLDHSNAKNVIAEIGFGQALLDFGNLPVQQCNVQAAVGAGTLKVILPKSTPVIIYVKDSPLCALEMIKNYEEVEKNVYISMEYDSHADNLLTINIDVALGNVTFSYKD